MNINLKNNNLLTNAFLTRRDIFNMVLNHKAYGRFCLS